MLQISLVCACAPPNVLLPKQQQCTYVRYCNERRYQCHIGPQLQLAEMAVTIGGTDEEEAAQRKERKALTILVL